MATEIERKFLVAGDAWSNAPAIRYTQGYLNRDKHRTVRVRIAGDDAFLTIKGITSASGASRAEFEYAIPIADALQLLAICDGPLIDKSRRIVLHDGHRWEVDEFFGDNAGLIVAEIELESERQEFSRPPWLGREVTGDPRYFNSSLASTPYKDWRGQD